MCFDITPFYVSEIRKMDCQFGRHYYKETSCSSKDRTCLQGTRKRGCTAHIEIYTICTFPEYQLTSGDTAVGVKQLKEIKKEKLKDLRGKLATPSAIKMEQQFYVVLPTAKAHEQYHDTSGAVLFAQRIHPQLVKNIYEMVAEGIIDTQEVKRNLKHYVLHVMCLKQKPDIADRSYFPSSTDIRNHIYKAQQACQLSKLDQENLKLKIEGWKQENASSLYFFRPYTQSDSSDKENVMDGPQTLLFVHQEPWQQELLRRYGNKMTLMDATYKTTRYEVALFFVTVKTNVGYSVVSEFVVQSETKDSISEALKIISRWNPTWNPEFFMTDYSESEIGAITNVFPNCKTYICDFHREQCWERWVKERKHGLNSDDADTLLSYLRDIANAPSPTSPDLPMDYNYKKQVESLKSGKLWNNIKQIRDWLEVKWLSCPQVIITNA